MDALSPELHSSIEHNLLDRMVIGDVSVPYLHGYTRSCARNLLYSVSHLEELMFWMYIVNSGPSHSEWFNSPYFKTWAAGSVSALLYMPLAAIFTRQNPLRVRTPIWPGARSLLTGYYRMRQSSSSPAA